MKSSRSLRLIRLGSRPILLGALLMFHAAPAATITWNGGGGDANWSTSSNWGGATATNGDTLVFSGTSRLSNTNDLLTEVGPVTFTAGGFSITGNAVTLGGDFTSNGNTAWALATTLDNSRTFISNSGTLTLSGNLNNNGFAATITGAGDTLLSGILSGSGTLLKSGAGTLTLTNTNTFTGATRITGGAVAITADANLGSAPASATSASIVLDSGTLASSGSFTLNANRGIVVGPSSGLGDGTLSVASGELTYHGIITSNGVSGTGGLTKTGAGTLTLGGTNVYAGDTTISGGTLKLGSLNAIPSGVSKGDVSIAGSLDLNGYGATLNGLSGAGGITSNVAGTITLTVGGNNKGGSYTGIISNGSGTIGLTKIGTGTLTLGGASTFTGGVTINAGTLQLGHANGLGAATNSVTFGASAPATTKLQLNGISATIGGLATNATPGTVVVENASASNATLTINQAGNTTFAGILQNGTGAGTLGLTKSGAGTFTLTGNNTFTGTATVSAGTLALSGGSALADGAAVSLANTSGAGLLLNANETIGSLAGGGTTGGNVNLQSFTLTTGGANTDTTYSGTISGTGALIKTGTGTFTIGRGNTYTGSSSIKNGQIALGLDNALPTSTVLTLGDGTTNSNGIFKLNNYQQTLAGLTTAGSGTGNRVINGSATTKTLTLNLANSYTFSGILGGSNADEDNFNLVKTGTGTMTLSGANSYSGTTTISQGTLSMGNLSNALGSGATAIALSGGTLSYTGNTANFTRGFTVSASGGQIDTTTAGQTLTLSSGSIAITTTGNLTIGGAGNTTISTNITGASGGILTKTGSGTLTLSGSGNTYSGATHIKNGTLALGVNNGVNQTATVTLGDSSANTNGVLRLNGFAQTVFGLTTAGAGTGNRVTGGSSTLSNLTFNNTGSSTFAGILGGSGTNDNNLSLTKSGTGTIALTGTNTYTGGTTISGGILSINSNAALGSNSSSLTFNGAGTTTLLLAADITASSRAVSLATTGTIDTSTFSLTTSGVLSGTGGLTKSGSGTLTLSAANTYQGLTTIDNGTLAVSGGAALWDGGAVSITNRSGTNLLLNANETIGSLTGGGTSGGNVNLRAYTLTVGADNTSTTYAGVISGTGALTKTGTGTLTLSYANTFTGTTTISSGTLATLGGAAISDSSAVVLANTAGATLLLNANETIGSLAGGGTTGGHVNLQSFTLTAGSNSTSTSYAGVIAGTGGLTKSGTGTLTLTGANSYSGTTSVTAGTLALSGGAALADSSAVSLANTSGVVLVLNASETIGSLAGGGATGGHVTLNSFTLSTGANNSSTTYSGVISGTGGLTKVGTGALTLSRSSTYTGTTTISAGSLIYGTDSALPTGTGKGDVVIGASGILDINGRTSSNATLNGLTGTGIVTNNNATTANLTLGGNNASSTFNGSIQNGTGVLGLTKTGTGTLTLTPTTNNGFTGNIIIGTGGSGSVTVNAGILQVGNSNALNSTGANVVTFGRNTTSDSRLQINGNAVTIAGLATNSLTPGSPLVENANAAGGTLTISNAADYTYASVIQDGTGGGALSLVKNGAGTQTLSGVNTYTDSTQILGGTLSIRADSGLGAAPVSATAGQLIINGGTLQTTTNSFTLAANRGISLGSSSNSGSGTFEIVSTAGSILTTTYGGIIANNGSGTGGLVKIGLGNFALSDVANTYSGGTAINAGLLSVTSTSAGTPLGANTSTNNIAVNVGGNLSLSVAANKGDQQTITVNSDAAGRGGIGFSNAALSQTDLNGVFTNNTGSYGGVLSINNGITYATAIDLATFGSGDNLGKWFLGSASSGTYSPSTLTVGSDGLYRLGGGGGSLTLSGTNVITGANNVQVGFAGTNGNGIVTLSNSQNYSGTTTVAGGAVLAVSADNRLGTGNGAGNLVLDGGTLRSTASFTLGTALNLRGIALGSATGSATGTIDVNSGTLTYGGIMTNNGTGADNLAKIGAGTLLLTSSSINTFTGSTEINAGTLDFSRTENLGIGGAINFGGGTLKYATGNTYDITERTITTTNTSTTTTPNGATIDTNGNDVIFQQSAISGTGTFSKTGTGTLTLGVANTYTNNTIITAGTLKLGTANAIPSGTGNGTLSVTGTLDLNNFSPTINLLTGAGTVTNSQSGAVSLTVDTSNGTSGSTFSGRINDGSGNVSLVKIGGNTLTLTGSASSYSGGTTISAGILAISNDAALGAVPSSATPGSITIASGASLQSATNDITIAANRGIAILGNTAASISVATGKTLVYNGIIANTDGFTGGLTKASPSNYLGTLVLGGSNTYAGNTTISGGTLQVTNTAAIPSGPGKGNVSLTGTLDLSGIAITINGLSGSGLVTSSTAGSAGITVGANDQTSTYSGIIQNGSGTVSLGKTGTGTLTLSGTNTYSGGTLISAGAISISSDANIGAVPGSASPSNIVINGGGTLATTTSMTLNANRGLAIGPSSGTATLTPSNNTTLTYNGIITDYGSGTGGLTKANTTGTLVLGGANTYSGDTTVSGGTLQLSNAAAIPSGTGKGNLSLAGTLDLNNLSPTVNGLTGAGTVTNSQTGAVTFTAGANSATSAFSGIIQNGNGTVALTKTGTGTLTLSGANTYTGNTTIDAGGTLEAAIATAIPSGSGKGNVIVNGTLDLNVSLTVNGLSGSGTISTDTASAIVLTAGANDQSSDFGGNIVNGGGGGTVGLTKTGAGTLTLSGSNTYSGATTISTGTLQMGSSTGLSPNSTLTISGPGFLDINGNSVAMDGLLGTGTILNNGATGATLTAGAAGGSTSFGGVIADGSQTISLTKSGAGTLTLTGINTYSGTTTIANGTLSVANIAAGGNLGTGTDPIILGDATNQGTLSYTGSSDLDYSRGFTVNAGGGEINTTAAGKTLTLQGTEITTAGTFTVSGAGNALVQSIISGNGGLTKANTGAMILSSVNTYSGDTTIATGTLQVTNAAAIPSGTGKGDVIANGTLDMNNQSLTLNGLSGSGLVTNTAGSPVTLTVGGGDAIGNFTGIIQDGSGTTSLVKTGTGIQTLGGTNTYSGDTTVSAGTLQFGIAPAIPSGASKGNVVVDASGTIDLNDFEASINGLSGSGLVTNHAGASTLSVGNNNQTSSFSGNIQDGTGTIGLTKTGTGMLTLAGSNTYSGATTISQGTLSMGSDTGLSPASTLTIENAGALDLNGKIIAIDGLAGTGSITNNSGTDVVLTIGSSGGSGTFGGTINDGAGVIGLTKTGSGTVTLSNVNSYSGHTSVTGGLLAITSYGALGEIPASVHPANIMLNGGGISAANSFEIDAKRGIAVGPSIGSGSGILDAALNQTLTYNGIIANYESGSGGLIKTGPGTVTLGGINTYSGDTTLSEGALQIGNALAIPSGTGKGNLVLDGTLDLNNTSITVNGLTGTGIVSSTKTGSMTFTVGAADQTSTFAGEINDGNGTLALTKIGTGTLTLTGTNSDYSGPTTITAGTLSISSDANLGDPPSVATPGSLVIAAGATLAATESFTLDSNRGIAVGPTGAGTIDVLTAKTVTYGGIIADNGTTGGFSKTGEGRLILTGTSTFTGATTVEQGTLTVNGSLAASSSMSVKTGATLTGNGSTGAISVQTDGTISPGDGGIGTLNVSGGLSLAGIANFELGTPGISHAAPGISDRIAVTGDVIYGGTLHLIDNANAGGLGSVGAGSYKLITYTGTASGSFTEVNGLPAYHNALRDVAEDQALYIDLYNYAVATVTPSVDLGRIHAGGSFGTQALTVGNTAPAGAFTETLSGTFGTPSSGFTATGSATGIAGGAANASSLVVGISDNTAGAKSGMVEVNFTSQAVVGSGLGNTALSPQEVAITGFAYTGQSTWIAAGSGSWGNNTNDYARWDAAGGVPGLDGSLSAADRATFGNAIANPASISLNGANPSVSAVTFNSSNTYTLAQGTSGTLTLLGNGGPATVTVELGDHTISAPVTLGSAANFAITQQADALSVSGAISGSFGIAKTGAGTLLLAGENPFTGATQVNGGVLALTGSLADTSVTVASGATLTGAGTIGDAVSKSASLLVMENGTHAPGNDGPGLQSINGDATYQTGSIFAWELDASTADPGNNATDSGSYDRVALSGELAGNDAIFQVLLGTNDYADEFWNSNKHWTNVFAISSGLDLESLFTAFSGPGLAADGSVTGQGQFSFSGNTLNWSAVPEPSSFLTGLLIAAGMLQRRRSTHI